MIAAAESADMGPFGSMLAGLLREGSEIVDDTQFSTIGGEESASVGVAPSGFVVWEGVGKVRVDVVVDAMLLRAREADGVFGGSTFLGGAKILPLAMFAFTVLGLATSAVATKGLLKRTFGRGIEAWFEMGFGSGHEEILVVDGRVERFPLDEDTVAKFLLVFSPVGVEFTCVGLGGEELEMVHPCFKPGATSLTIVTDFNVPLRLETEVV